MLDKGKTCEKYIGRRINEQCLSSGYQVQWQEKNVALADKIEYIQIGSGPWVTVNSHDNACVPCAPGTFQVADVNPGGDCKMTMLMAASSNENCRHQKEQCEKCPIGQYQDNYGSAMCKDCPMGFASGPCTQCRQQGWEIGKDKKMS